MDRRPPAAVVLLLHGGQETGLGRPRPGPLNLPALRMRPFARALARATGGEGGVRVDVRRVRYRHRGWNGDREDPVQDVVRVLDALRREAGDIPVVLLGHSMGARAALRAAGHPLVRGVVGLAPWCPPGDPVTQLAGRDVVLLHSTRDRVTSPVNTQSLTVRARRAGARTCMVTVRDSDHAMVRRAQSWHRAATVLVTGLLDLGPLPDPVRVAFRLGPDAPVSDGVVALGGLYGSDGSGGGSAEPASGDSGSGLGSGPGPGPGGSGPGPGSGSGSGTTRCGAGGGDRS